MAPAGEDLATGSGRVDSRSCCTARVRKLLCAPVTAEHPDLPEDIAALKALIVAQQLLLDERAVEIELTCTR